MGFTDSIKAFFKNYTNFSGKAERSEFWWAFLFLVLSILVLIIIGTIVGPLIVNPSTGEMQSLNSLTAIWELIVFIPYISLTVRRLHDVDKSGWWYLISFIPFGTFVLLYFNAQPSSLMSRY